MPSDPKGYSCACWTEHRSHAINLHGPPCLYLMKWILDYLQPPTSTGEIERLDLEEPEEVHRPPTLTLYFMRFLSMQANPESWLEIPLYCLCHLCVHYSPVGLFWVSHRDYSSSLSSPCIISFSILHSFFQGGQRKGKRVRVTSPHREASNDPTSLPLLMGSSSQPQKWSQPWQDLSTDSSDDERNLVSFAHIMNAAEEAESQFQGAWISSNRWAGPLFSDDSSDTEYTSATELSISASSPLHEDDCVSSGSSKVLKQELIVFTKDSDEDEEIDVVH